ncbi:MAG: hypothetical protein U0132_02185 [Gemmatimonadaceae bacterium]
MHHDLTLHLTPLRFDTLPCPPLPIPCLPCKSRASTRGRWSSSPASPALARWHVGGEAAADGERRYLALRRAVFLSIGQLSIDHQTLASAADLLVPPREPVELALAFAATDDTAYVSRDLGST